CRTASWQEASAIRLWKPPHHIGCATPPPNKWRSCGPHSLSLRSARLRESESCSCARRSPGKVAVLAEAGFSRRRVPYACCDLEAARLIRCEGAFQSGSYALNQRSRRDRELY